mmetsp:Transcript_18144/g.42732  ORF Transcript_18144/g.42732 Transcript_18144/m.42732 type:complete len:87 (+) Transcript_18144:258-518(+)
MRVHILLLGPCLPDPMRVWTRPRLKAKSWSSPDRPQLLLQTATFGMSLNQFFVQAVVQLPELFHLELRLPFCQARCASMLFELITQ